MDNILIDDLDRHLSDASCLVLADVEDSVKEIMLYLLQILCMIIAFRRGMFCKIRVIDHTGTIPPDKTVV